MEATEQSARSLLKLSLDFRVALAHSPLDPKTIHGVTAGWFKEENGFLGNAQVRYGFVLRYRGRWVYLWGVRTPGSESAEHGLQWFDAEPTYLYDRPVNWQFDIAEILDGPYFFTEDEGGEARLSTADTDNAEQATPVGSV